MKLCPASHGGKTKMLQDQINSFFSERRAAKDIKASFSYITQ